MVLHGAYAVFNGTSGNVLENAIRNRFDFGRKKLREKEFVHDVITTQVSSSRSARRNSSSFVLELIMRSPWLVAFYMKQ